MMEKIIIVLCQKQTLMMLIYSNYGIIVYDELNHGGTVYLNYENNTTNVSFHLPTPNNNKAAGIKVYYKGTLLP
jgi:hypothetical protein